jgi:gamma-glutamylputrescine oxidase
MSGLTWYEDTAVATAERPRLTADLDIDVCVVGGGLAGLTVAREVARRGWSVAVLETRHVAWNASGSNCGFVVPGFAQNAEKVTERVGREHAKALWALSSEGVDYVRNTIRETAMARVDPVEGWLEVSKINDADGISSQVGLLAQEFGLDVESWPTERVRTALRSELYFQALHFRNAFHIHALNYARGLAALAEREGVRIFEDTPALSIDPAGVRKRVVTPMARLRAGYIVLAGNVHLGGLAPQVAGTLMPITTYVAVTAPLGKVLANAISYRGAVSDSRSADSHYRIVDGDRLMWAGGLTTWSDHSSKIGRRFERNILRLYPQLEQITIDRVWSGVMGYAVHRMPQIGEISPGVWLASAFGGHGINTTAMAGNLIARAMVDGDDAWKLFLPYALVWGGGKLGQAAIQVAYWSRRNGEQLIEQFARRRPNRLAPMVEQKAELETDDVVAETQESKQKREFLTQLQSDRRAKRKKAAGEQPIDAKKLSKKIRASAKSDATSQKSSTERAARR